MKSTKARIIGGCFFICFCIQIARGAKRFKKKAGDKRLTLTEEDLKYLERNTRYTYIEIKEWFRYDIIQILIN